VGEPLKRIVRHLLVYRGWGTDGKNTGTTFDSSLTQVAVGANNNNFAIAYARFDARHSD
jgi:hypothetical protein